MSQTTDEAPSKPATAASNRYDRLECAGAFGDLGTLIPFLVAYITLVKVDPFGILFAFGVCMVVAGFYYRTPFPVQPMKAIGAVATTQAAQTYTITASTLYVAALATGLIWMILGLTGAAKKIASWLPRSVAIGIILGLGISLMLEGIKMIAMGWVLGLVALTMTFVLLDSRRFPVMFLLLIGGAAYQFVVEPQLLARFLEVQPQFRLPTLTFGAISLSDIAVGVMVLALPQIPLTLGNAVVAITEENNKLFPHRLVTEKGVAVSTGFMNLFSG
jgi:xanthine/uracil/vitamin C permease (AzgA family)